MRRPPLLLLLALLAAAHIACEDPEDVDGGADGGVVDLGQPLPDVGVADTGMAPDLGTPDAADADAADPDAADPDAADPDATPVDAEVDAGPPDTGVGLVRVIYEGLGQIQLPVVFQDSTGAVLTTVTTSAGEANALVPPGSMITFQFATFTGKGGGNSVNTVVGVQPGDIYRIDPYGGGSGIYLGDAEIELPGPYTGAVEYYVDYGCGQNYVPNPSVAQVYGVFSECQGFTTNLGVLATAHDVNNDVIAFSLLDPAVVNSTTSITLLTLGAWQTVFVNMDVGVTNPPTGALDVDVQRAMLRAGVPVAYDFGFLDLTGGAGGSVPFSMPDFGDGQEALFQLDLGTASSSLLARSMGRAPLVVDLSMFLPAVETASVVDTGDFERPDVRWVAHGAQADGAIVQVYLYDPYFNWNFIIPAGITAVTIPELPTEFDSFRPIVSTTYLQVGFLLFEANVVPNYATFRQGAAMVMIRRFNQTTQDIPLGSIIRISRVNSDL